MQAVFFRIFWFFFAVFVDKNDFLIFFRLIFIFILICIAIGAKLSFASVLNFRLRRFRFHLSALLNYTKPHFFLTELILVAGDKNHSHVFRKILDGFITLN